ncbi:uncharacterized [Lates japonicus]
MESIDDPLTDSQTPSTTNTTNNNNSSNNNITTTPPKPWSHKGRKQHKSTRGLLEAARSHNTARGGKTRE